MYDFLKVTWLKCDPSRFNQILVNLLTNAIKFTSLQRGPREISVRLDAARDRPPRIGRIYLQHSHEEVDSDVSMTGAEWGTGDPVYILVTVKDSGIGISEKWQAKLFNRFEQVPKTHITYGGSGLGLFICRKLCRIQGGEIGVYSQEGKGSTFAFYIQARRTDPPPNHIASHRSLAQDKDAHLQSPLSLDFPHLPKSTRGSSFPLTAVTSALYDNDDTFDTLDQSGALNTSNVGYSRPSGAGRTASETFVPHSSATPATRATLSQFKPIKSPSIQPVPRGITVRTPYRVLIVEDNVINQEVLRRQLRREGCVAYVANNGQEALNFIARSSFAVKDGTELDVVLMDMEMPIMDGNTATRRIRGWEREGVLVKHVPIMGISANARSEQVSEMTKAGMDDAISKPFRIVDLLQRFNSLMGALEENGGADGGKSLKGKRRVEKKEEKKGKQQAEEPKENGKGGLDNISWEPLPSVLELQKSPSPMNPLL